MDFDKCFQMVARSSDLPVIISLEHNYPNAKVFQEGDTPIYLEMYEEDSNTMTSVGLTIQEAKHLIFLLEEMVKEVTSPTQMEFDF